MQVSYGAGDDSAGVSTLLETARALKAGDAPRDDVVLVFTDTEEACLRGAEAFMNIAITSDIPVGAGLSSSAAIEGAGATALDDLWGPD